MPRVRYKPWTLYEEVMGLKNCKRAALTALTLLFFNMFVIDGLLCFSRLRETSRAAPPDMEGGGGGGFGPGKTGLQGIN